MDIINLINIPKSFLHNSICFDYGKTRLWWLDDNKYEVNNNAPTFSRAFQKKLQWTSLS